MNEHFSIERRRPFMRITFRALAVRYFPSVIPEVASRKLRQLLKSDPAILKELRKSGYRPHQHYLSFVQCACIESYLGTPEEFMTYY